ncbi:hypothetical protein DID97_05215 [Burkholderia sp. Bp8977]|nr:hypothetical protein DIE10_05550 [Burkholderia sp. Bp9011]RQR96911.1 hypothetical protein DIE09_05735 [Burkholderia sp. Bp9010]RQS80616.1 hypothetical protein DID97_05215 [Burkholderia sp. Bp8977]
MTGTGARGVDSSIRRYVDTSIRRYVDTSIRRYVDSQASTYRAACRGRASAVRDMDRVGGMRKNGRSLIADRS